MSRKGPPSFRKALTPLWVFGLVVFSALRLNQRWREEAIDNRVALMADWNEFRELAAREALSAPRLLGELKSHSLTAVLLAPTSLAELVAEQRVRIKGPSASADPFDVHQVIFPELLLARQVQAELAARQVSDLRLDEASGTLTRLDGTFAALKDIDVGVDPLLRQSVQAAGLVAVYRLYRDPWMSLQTVVDSLRRNTPSGAAWGVVFTSDELPGGRESFPFWRSWIQREQVIQGLLEFHPAKASWLMANALPAFTYRAHTIPPNELKDLKPEEQLSRWRRAVEERSCRLLLMHVSPNDSLADYLAMLSTTAQMVGAEGWRRGFPQPRLAWGEVTFLQRTVFPWVALLTAIFVPMIALRNQMSSTAKASDLSGVLAFAKITLVTVGGALVVAALAQNPETRLEIIPFRGIKVAFLLSWSLCFFVLYRGEDLIGFLRRSLQRWELVALVALGGVVGYMIIRSGNASVDWKNPWEQPVREFLESALVARPRFKEFLIGHPLLILGFAWKGRLPWKGVFGDARPLILLGMLGQISIVNTFCHLHSPLRMELLRTFNGVLLGGLLGGVALWIGNGCGISARRVSES